MRSIAYLRQSTININIYKKNTTINKKVFTMQTISINIHYDSNKTWFIGTTNVSANTSYGETIDEWRKHEGFVTEWAFNVTTSVLQVVYEDTVYVTTSGSYEHTGFEPGYIPAGTLYYNGVLVKSPCVEPSCTLVVL